MGELQIQQGEIQTRGRMCYVEQEPYIISDSIKQNILFGLPFEEQRFEKCLKLSCLKEDIERMKDGVETQIGERGINISGGQKARISFARAIYSDSDIYLLDDPLSALDHQVGEKIYKECICEYLKDRCVILVTHQVHLLKNVNTILVLDEGKIIERGSYTHIERKDNKRYKEESKHDDSGDSSDESINSESKYLANHENKISYSSSNLDESIEISIDINEIKADFGLLSRLESLSRPKHNIKSVSAPLPKNKLLAVYDASKLIKERSLNNFENEGYRMTSYAEISSPVKISDWFKVISYGIGNFWNIVMIFLSFLYNGLQVYILIVLSSWVVKSKKDQQSSNDFYLYMGLSLCSAILMWAANVLNAKVFRSSSKNLHSRMVYKVLRAPLHFFDKNSIGSIVTKFSKDIQALNDYIPTFMFLNWRIITKFSGNIVLMAIAAPIILIPMFIVIIVYFIVRSKCSLSIQNLEWLESESRGPINTKFSSIIDGVMSVRAYNRERFFINSYFQDCDKVSSICMTCYAVSSWFLSILDYFFFVVVSINIIITFLLSYYTDLVSADYLSMSIVSSASSMLSLSFIAINLIMLDSQMKLLKNALDYATMEEEAEVIFESDPQDWPKTGAIEFDQATMMYKGTDKPALNGISLKIYDKQKIGIKGRTGAGKSSIVNTLFRMYELDSGTIFIDGVDIGKIGLHTLRKHISYN